MELRDLGTKVLKLPQFVIDTALYNHRTDINEAAHVVVSTWCQQLENQQEAYDILQAELQKKIQQAAVVKSSETAADDLKASETVAGMHVPQMSEECK